MEAETLLGVIGGCVGGGIALGLTGRKIFTAIMAANSGKSKQQDVSCPVKALGGTPMSKEQHDETCNLRIAVVEKDISSIKEDVKHIREHLDGGS
jgi:hypothetical protein